MVKIFSFDELYEYYQQDKESIKAIHYGYNTICNDGGYSTRDFERYYCYLVNGIIVHITKVWWNKKCIKLDDKLVTLLNYSSTNPEFKNLGYAKLVLTKLVADIKEANLSLYMSFYTEEGFNTIAKTVDRLCKEYKVELWDGALCSDKIYKPYHLI